MGNLFTKAMQSHDARTWNNAVSHSTSGKSYLDYGEYDVVDTPGTHTKYYIRISWE